MTIDEKEFAKELNKSYMRGWQDAIEYLESQKTKIDNNLNNPINKPYTTDNDIYEKAPYWMRPGFNLQPSCISTMGTGTNVYR